MGERKEGEREEGKREEEEREVYERRGGGWRRERYTEWHGLPVDARLCTSVWLV